MDSIFRFPFYLPPLPIQRKIAAILSAYDELIENNNRRIAILEKMAEDIYREWFVRLRFPGHEKVKVVKGVPEGWEVKKISELLNFLSGFSFKSETYIPNGKYGVVTIKNVQNGFFVQECTDYIDELPSKMNEYCLLKTGDILMSLTGNVGRVCRVIGNGLVLNQRVAKFQPKLKHLKHFLYYTFKSESMVQTVENLSLGSTAQLNLSPIQLGKQKIVTPDVETLKRFCEVLEPIERKILSTYLEIANLKSTRDLLLPRLVSGKLDVENLAIAFPPGMEEECS